MLGAALVAGGPAAAGNEPAPLAGVPLTAETELRLVVATRPVVIFDVDAGTSGEVAALRSLGRDGPLSVLGVGRSALIETYASGQRRYRVLGPGGQVHRLGSGQVAVPGADGRSVWIRVRQGAGECPLRQLSLTGRVLHEWAGFPCRALLQAGGVHGIVVGRTRLIDPVSRATITSSSFGILAVAADGVLLAGPGGRLLYTGLDGRIRKRFARPSGLDGSIGAVVDPSGRWIALEFGNPSDRRGQVMDAWVFDTRTRALEQLPGMPALVALKFTSLAWAGRGRLVLLGESEGREFVAVWRPGDRQLALKPVAIPDRAGSDSFAVLGTGR